MHNESRTDTWAQVYTMDAQGNIECLVEGCSRHGKFAGVLPRNVYGQTELDKLKEIVEKVVALLPEGTIRSTRVTKGCSLELEWAGGKWWSCRYGCRGKVVLHLHDHEDYYCDNNTDTPRNLAAAIENKLHRMRVAEEAEAGKLEPIRVKK